MYADRYPNKFHLPHNLVYRLLRGLNEHGQFSDNQNERQQPKPNCFDKDIVAVMAYIYAYPRSSIRHLSREIDISVGGIHIISKKYKIHPYKVLFNIYK